MLQPLRAESVTLPAPGSAGAPLSKSSRMRSTSSGFTGLVMCSSNPAAFAAPAAGTFGNAPRNGVYGPGQYQWDLALFKNFGVRTGHSLQFRAEIFNITNHPNWSNPNTDPTSSSFGRVTGKDNARRDIQMSIRYVF